MTSQTINCVIERRLLVNYRIDPERVAQLLPSPLRPQLVREWAVGGVCFIRLSNTRPAHVPSALGVTSDNVAHRYAVEWNSPDGTRTGVFVPRRDTNSRLISMAGGRLFPGRYHLAGFVVDEQPSRLEISVESRDRQTRLHVTVQSAGDLDGQVFDSVEDATTFFRLGNLGYSPSSHADHLDGVVLTSDSWAARPVRITEMTSSVFDNHEVFPAGSCTLDSALLMENLNATWTTQESLATICPAVLPAAEKVRV